VLIILRQFSCGKMIHNILRRFLAINKQAEELDKRNLVTSSLKLS